MAEHGGDDPVSGIFAVPPLRFGSRPRVLRAARRYRALRHDGPAQSALAPAYLRLPIGRSVSSVGRRLDRSLQPQYVTCVQPLRRGCPGSQPGRQSAPAEATTSDKCRRVSHLSPGAHPLRAVDQVVPVHRRPLGHPGAGPVFEVAQAGARPLRVSGFGAVTGQRGVRGGRRRRRQWRWFSGGIRGRDWRT